MNDATPTASSAERVAAVTGELRPPLGIQDLLGILTSHQLLSPDQARDVEVRSATLRSRVLKERVGSVRSQAATRYDVSPAEIIAAAHVPHPTLANRTVDEDLIAEALAGNSTLQELRLAQQKLPVSCLLYTSPSPRD